MSVYLSVGVSPRHHQSLIATTGRFRWQKLQYPAPGFDHLSGQLCIVTMLADDEQVLVHIQAIGDFLLQALLREAQTLGLKTTATMMIGTVETAEERISHLQKIRDLQDRTGGFMSFISWTFQPGNTALGGRAISPVEYLRTLSISRLFLDNFTNVQGSWVTQGRDIGQICLSFGANDLGSIMIEENVVRAAGVSHRITVSEMVDLIHRAGKIPAQRDTEFNLIKVYHE